MSDWDDFEKSLATTLRSVTDRVFLIVFSAAEPRRYVQLAGGPDRVDVEAPGTDVVADADETVLDAAGWTPPGVAQPNWTAALPLPALTTEHHGVARQCVRALRYAYGLTSPDDLGYRAWREPEMIPPGETWSADRVERMDRGDRALRLPTLGTGPDERQAPETSAVLAAPAVPSWKAMSPAEVCDLMDFWAAQPWPLSPDEVHRAAVERLGWTVEVEDGTSYLMNTASGLTVPDVSTVGSRGELSHLSLRTSDVVRPVTAASTAFLGDTFTLLVRAREVAWGAPTMRRREDSTSATWDLASGARVSFTCAVRSLSAMFETPQGVALDQRAGW